MVYHKSKTLLLYRMRTVLTDQIPTLGPSWAEWAPVLTNNSLHRCDSGFRTYHEAMCVFDDTKIDSIEPGCSGNNDEMAVPNRKFSWIETNCTYREHYTIQHI